MQTPLHTENIATTASESCKLLLLATSQMFHYKQFLTVAVAVDKTHFHLSIYLGKTGIAAYERMIRIKIR